MVFADGHFSAHSCLHRVRKELAVRRLKETDPLGKLVLVLFLLEFAIVLYVMAARLRRSIQFDKAHAGRPEATGILTCFVTLIEKGAIEDSTSATSQSTSQKLEATFAGGLFCYFYYDFMAPHSGQSSQLIADVPGRNAHFVPTVVTG
jgi:hypothetical protein